MGGMTGSGGKTSTGTQTNSSQFTPQLMSLFNMAKPTLSTLSAQTQSGLQTGGVNTQIPSINASLAASRQAYSTSQQALKNQLGESGLANSSFGRQILGQSAATAGQGIADIPTNMTNNFLRGAAPTVVGAGVGALGQAAGLNTTGTTKSTPSAWDSFVQAAHFGMDPAGLFGGAGAGAAGKGGGGGGSSGGIGSSGASAGMLSYAGDAIAA